MAILKIARMGHPVLMGQAQTVNDPKSEEIKTLVKNMIDTMGDAQGIGLAAPQVHIPLRVVVFFVPEERDNSSEAVPLTVLINPKIKFLSEIKIDGVEGCLSLPGMEGIVPRCSHIKYDALQLDGTTLSREARGYHARVVQHECDHLDGVLYPMRMEDISKLGYSEEIYRTITSDTEN